ncbi:hypothetical protein BDZ94DRAFT_1263409, partial [Collybia nuda]
SPAPCLPIAPFFPVPAWSSTVTSVYTGTASPVKLVVAIGRPAIYTVPTHSIPPFPSSSHFWTPFCSGWPSTWGYPCKE